MGPCAFSVFTGALIRGVDDEEDEVDNVEDNEDEEEEEEEEEEWSFPASLPPISLSVSISSASFRTCLSSFLAGGALLKSSADD